MFLIYILEKEIEEELDIKENEYYRSGIKEGEKEEKDEKDENRKIEKEV